MKPRFSIKILFFLLFGAACFFAGLTLKPPIPRKPIEIERDTAIVSDAQDVEYRPETFKADVERLIRENDYATAIVLLDSAYVDDQIRYENNADHFFGIGGNQILIPGAVRDFDSKKDWVIPAGGESLYWFERAERFARKYNSRLLTQANQR